MNYNTISGSEAIAKMRQLRNDENSHFVMHHLTFNQKTQTTNGMRIVDECRLRPSLPNEKMEPDGDLFLPYMDIEIKEPRMCYKKLIRYVAFPPKYELLKVIWV